MSLRPKKFLIYFLLSLFASHIIASLGLQQSTLGVMRLSGYFYALSSGAVISILILYILSFVNQKLNNNFPWKGRLFKRTFFQILLGLIFPFIIILTSVTGYFWLADIWILNTGWLEYCSAAIIVMLIFANIIIEIFAEKIDVENNFVEFKIPKTPLEPSKAKMFVGRPYSELIYISAEGKKKYAMFDDGSEHNFNITITSAMLLYDGSTHLQANRAQIIKVSSIKKTRWVDNKRLRIQVFIKGFENLEIIFSEKQTSTHKKLLKQYMGRVD